MKNMFDLIKRFVTRSFLIFGVLSIICATNLVMPLYGYAEAEEVNKGSEEIVQPFELTRPAETREEAYENAAQLTENPKELIKAQNQEEKAQEKVQETVSKKD